MNRTFSFSSSSKFLFRIVTIFRLLRPKSRSHTFGSSNTQQQPKIGRIYVINLNRQPSRWAAMERELRHLLDTTGIELWNLTERLEAVDAIQLLEDPSKDTYVDPVYTLKDQLYVEPQPLALPSRMELSAQIQMSRPEIAVARSHIQVWQKVIESAQEYALILEDDVWFRSGFAKNLDKAWAELKEERINKSNFDILYLSYEEVKHGAPKTILSSNLFCPIRGLWHLSGYVVSREGAKKLLGLLPCRGPVDLWINHQFELLVVRAIRKSIISQRRDVLSTNSYSILPTLTKIGAITSETASLFHVRPSERPVFAFGSSGSGLSSLSMALSMLGYRCCSDLETLPLSELEMLLTGNTDRVFDAYVNIEFLTGKIQMLKTLYPHAKFILTTKNTEIKNDIDLKIINDLEGVNTIILHEDDPYKWQVVCEHLRCAPPACSFPKLADLGQRQVLYEIIEAGIPLRTEITKRDKSPWVVESRQSWQGIHSIPLQEISLINTTPISINDCLMFLDTKFWFPRNDTFTDNLALFRPSNIEFPTGLGATLSIKRESLGMREFSAAAITSCDRYLFGRFEAIIKASNVPGVITGFFLHRDSPRQEIDIEFAGNQTDRLLINVFYNPGSEGSKFDYGYRGAPTFIDLGFDASKSYHLYSIEWRPNEIRWYVDNQLIHRRVEWDPTPIPHLPMFLHANIWPCRSKELAGRLVNHQLPAITFIKSIVVEANRYHNS